MTPLNYRDHRIYLVHLLRVLNRRGASPPADVYEEVADLAGVTPEERAVPGKEVGWNPVYRNRIQFARQGLVDAGLVVGSSDPGHRASHSLFVTSSRFSADAVDAARDEGIRLIEGMAFVELMAQHGIGLRAKDTFVLYELDPAWSVNDLEDAA